jgi:hypothetical protein
VVVVLVVFVVVAKVVPALDWTGQGSFYEPAA